MADALTVIPAAVLRNLSDKLYEKRKNAALEVCLFTFLHRKLCLPLPCCAQLLEDCVDLGGRDCEAVNWSWRS